MSNSSSTRPARSWLGRWTPRLYIAAAVALVPWDTYLAFSLPERAISPHYRGSWVIYDAVLCIVLARIGCRIEGTPCLVASTISRQSWAISEAKTSEVYSRGAERWKLALGAMEKVSQALF